MEKLNNILKHNGTVRLETDRLILRKFEIKDLDELNIIVSDKEAMKNTDWNSKSFEDTKTQLNTIISNYDDKLKYVWAIEAKEDNKLIGVIELIDLYHENMSGEFEYFIRRESWGKGYVTEALKEAIRYLLLEVNMLRLTAYFIDSNIGSKRVLEKAGMKLESHSRAGLYTNNGFSDGYGYAIIRDDLIKDDLYKDIYVGSV
ncbi:MAG: GNAT family N-acetyltransferase [Clostridia bacterium]|jgi:RimJ/RimL family protein N-acetyltransferase|nr:GNAT family N-acetyltransferase [Clostridia bacterium]